MNIGFIGLGIMGKPMAKNLVKAGYAVYVYNRSRAAVDELAAAGANACASIAEVCAHSEIIITMLPNGPDVKAVALNIAALAEGLMLARKAGADPQRVFEAIRGGLAGSTVMNAKAPMMISGEFKPGFRIDLHIKDLHNALDTGEASGSPLPLCAQAMQIFQNLKADGCEKLDHSAMALYYEKLSGETIG